MGSVRSTPSGALNARGTLQCTFMSRARSRRSRPLRPPGRRNMVDRRGGNIWRTGGTKRALPWVHPAIPRIPSLRNRRTPRQGSADGLPALTLPSLGQRRAPAAVRAPQRGDASRRRYSRWTRWEMAMPRRLRSAGGTVSCTASSALMLQRSRLLDPVHLAVVMPMQPGLIVSRQRRRTRVFR